MASSQKDAELSIVVREYIKPCIYFFKKSSKCFSEGQKDFSDMLFRVFSLQCGISLIGRKNQPQPIMREGILMERLVMPKK